MRSQEAIEAYTKALKQAQKEVKELNAAGKPALFSNLFDMPAPCGYNIGDSTDNDRGDFV